MGDGPRRSVKLRRIPGRRDGIRSGAMQRTAALLAIALISLVGCSSDSTNPKAACDKLASCSLSSSGFSCDASKDSDCAACVNETACADITLGKCTARCPGATFKPK